MNANVLVDLLEMLDTTHAVMAEQINGKSKWQIVAEFCPQWADNLAVFNAELQYLHQQIIELVVKNQLKLSDDKLHEFMQILGDKLNDDPEIKCGVISDYFNLKVA